MTGDAPLTGRPSTEARLPERFKERHVRRLEDAEHHGEQDGRRNIPALQQDYETPFEAELRQTYQGEMSGLFSECSSWLQQIHDQRVEGLRGHLEDIERDPNFVAQEIAKSAANRDRELQEAQDNHVEKLKAIENESSWDKVKRSFEASQDRFRAIADKHGRTEPDVHVRTRVYVPMLTLIGLAEVPINYQVFVSFREAPWLTLIMAGALVISIPLIAHGTGKFIRQFRENRAFLFLLAIAVLLMLALSYVTATLRSDYLSALAGAVPTSPTNDPSIFFLIGIALYFVGTILSFFSHDPSIEFTLEYRSHVRARHAYDLKREEKDARERAERDRFEGQRRSIQDTFTQAKHKWDSRQSALEDALVQAVADYDAELNYLKGFEKTINSGFKEAVQRYRKGNLTYRLNHAHPAYWKRDIPDLQFHFQELSELSENPRE